MSILLGGILLFFLYLLPGVAATWYKTENHVAVLLINIFFGWTVLGWIVALMLAISGLSGKQVVKTLIFTILFTCITVIVAAFEYSSLT